MDKPQNFGVIVFLGLLVMCLCTLVFWMLLKFSVQDGEFKRQQRESQKAAMLLREEREKLERLLKAVEKTEKGNQ